MYRCSDCLEVFEKPDTICTDCGYDTEYVHIPYYCYDDLCPYCGSDDIEEFDEYEEEEEDE